MKYYVHNCNLKYQYRCFHPHHVCRQCADSPGCGRSLVLYVCGSCCAYCSYCSWHNLLTIVYFYTIDGLRVRDTHPPPCCINEQNISSVTRQSWTMLPSCLSSSYSSNLRSPSYCCTHRRPCLTGSKYQSLTPLLRKVSFRSFLSTWSALFSIRYVCVMSKPLSFRCVSHAFHKK